MKKGQMSNSSFDRALSIHLGSALEAELKTKKFVFEELEISLGSKLTPEKRSNLVFYLSLLQLEPDLTKGLDDHGKIF